MKNGVIYKITNLINNKVYIGQTINKYPKTRWSAHKLNYKNNKKHPLYNSMKKYGLDNFKFEIIENNIVKNLMNKKEIYYIKKYDCVFPKGYNLTKGGESLRGKDNPMYGRTGDKNPNYNNRWTKKQKEDLSKKLTGHPGMIGKKNPMYGKKPWNKGMKKTDKEKELDRIRQKTCVSVKMYKDDKLIKIFISLGQAANWIRKNTTYKKADCSTIKKSIDNNWNCYKYKFKYNK